MPPSSLPFSHHDPQHNQPPITKNNVPSSVIECRLLDACLGPVARKFRAVKFVRIVATAAVENWPDRNLPTLFVYRNGALQTQLLGIKRLGGRGVTADGGWVGGCACLDKSSFGVCVPIHIHVHTDSHPCAHTGVLTCLFVFHHHLHLSTPPPDLEWFLSQEGIVESEMEEDPRVAAKRKGAGGGGGGGGGVIRRGYADLEDSEGESD